MAGVVVLVSMALAPRPAAAFFHLWRFTEFFSNHDGSVQFIELRNTSNNEHFANGAQIRSLSTGKVFTFPNNLSSSSTANKNLLIATAGFGSLPGGVTPDFTLPSTNFFNPASDTLTLFAGFNIDAKSFTLLPTDGVTSRHYNPTNGTTSLGTNTPTNFTGASGSMNLPPPATPTGDYNGNGTVDAADYTVWQDSLGESVTPAGSGADGDESGTIDAGDYTFWNDRFGDTVSGSAAHLTAVPEPTAMAVLLAGLCAISPFSCRTRARRSPARWRLPAAPSLR
jgi:hypothetical protein